MGSAFKGGREEGGEEPDFLLVAKEKVGIVTQGREKERQRTVTLI